MKIFIFWYESALKDGLSTFKEPKHDTQNWFTARNNNSQNCDAIGFACRICE